MVSSGLILTGPRGGGKTAVARRLLAGARFGQPVGVTTRPARPDDRGAYRYLSFGEFAAVRAAGELFISSRYAGNWYGVRQSDLDQLGARGRRPLLTLTPEAALRAAGPRVGGRPGWTALFLDAPDETLDRRLSARDGRAADPVQRAADRALRGHLRLIWNDGPLDAAVESVHRALEATDVPVHG